MVFFAFLRRNCISKSFDIRHIGLVEIYADGFLETNVVGVDILQDI